MRVRGPQVDGGATGRRRARAVGSGEGRASCARLGTDAETRQRSPREPGVSWRGPSLGKPSPSAWRGSGAWLFSGGAGRWRVFLPLRSASFQQQRHHLWCRRDLRIGWGLEMPVPPGPQGCLLQEEEIPPNLYQASRTKPLASVYRDRDLIDMTGAQGGEVTYPRSHSQRGAAGETVNFSQGTGYPRKQILFSQRCTGGRQSSLGINPFIPA